MMIKQLNIGGGSDYFYSDLVNLKDFNPDLIKLSRNELANNAFIYHVSYDKKYPLRVYIEKLDGYTTEETHKGWSNKYLNISSTDANGALINYAKVWKGINNKISEMYNDLEGEYDKDLIKITVNSDDDLLWDKVVKLHMLTITIRHVFKRGNKYYLRIFKMCKMVVKEIEIKNRSYCFWDDGCTLKILTLK